LDHHMSSAEAAIDYLHRWDELFVMPVPLHISEML
jgi:hypothetical protein